MRIGFNFHSVDSYISGVEYYSLGLLRALLDSDRQNSYLVFTNRPDIVRDYIGNRDNLTVRDCSFLKNRLHRILWEHLKLPSLVQKEKLDILHCPHYICPAIKSSKGSVAYVTTLHDTIALDNPRWCKRSNAAYYRVFMPKAINIASKIIAVSKFTAERINRNFNLNGSKVEMICPGIDAGIFDLHQDIEKPNQVRARYNLPENYILYAGNIEPKKNILNLLKTVRLLKNKNPEYRLVITGKRSWKSNVVFNFLRSEFDPGDVTLAGYVDRGDMGSIFKMADCLALPSFCEGFGFPALEAFACGVPVAASCVGILQEIDTNAYTCLDPQDPEQMAVCIHQLLTDHKIRERQIKTALSEVQRFNWSDCAAKTLELYREVAQKNVK